MELERTMPAQWIRGGIRATGTSVVYSAGCARWAGGHRLPVHNLSANRSSQGVVLQEF